MRKVEPLIVRPPTSGLIDLDSEVTLAHLKSIAADEAVRIKSMSTVGKDVTVTVILSRPPLNACFTKGPHHVEIAPMVAQAAHEAVNEIARKNA